MASLKVRKAGTLVGTSPSGGTSWNGSRSISSSPRTCSCLGASPTRAWPAIGPPPRARSPTNEQHPQSRLFPDSGKSLLEQHEARQRECRRRSRQTQGAKRQRSLRLRKREPFLDPDAPSSDRRVPSLHRSDRPGRRDPSVQGESRNDEAEID